MKRLLVLLAITCLVATVSPNVFAQGGTPTAEELHQRLLVMQNSLNDTQNTMPLEQFPYSLPGITSNIPSGKGGGPGSIVFGLGIWFDENGNADGLVGANFGLGDPVQSVGANIGVQFLDINNFGQRGSVNLHLHKRVSNSVALAIGWEEALRWDRSNNRSDSPGPSVYVVATKLLVNKNIQDINRPGNRFLLTGGIGDGRFRSEADIEAGKDTLNFFGGVAVNVSRNADVFTEWTGRALNLGACFPISEKNSIYVTPVIIDIMSETSVGRRLLLGISFRVR